MKVPFPCGGCQWLSVGKQVPKAQCKGFDSMAPLVIWSLWKEQNRCVHDKVMLQPEEARRWDHTGFVEIRSLVVPVCSACRSGPRPLLLFFVLSIVLLFLD
jgi:hypothetical protein